MKNINQITTDNSDYLKVLSTLAKCPDKLYFIGALPTSRLPSVAIVGSRKPTAYGKEVAYRLSYDLASHGVVIISGLAIGIDGVAHQGAVDAGGKTIAVLANGLPKIYPSSHQQLTEVIIKSGGAIITEYPPNTPGYRNQFLERNRIVSGLCDVLLVVEAASRSGTLNTASYALEQGKDVTAIPGNITSPMSAGCNNLIKQGATPVTEAKDILRLLGYEDNKSDQQQLLFAGSEDEMTLIKLIAGGTRAGTDLQQLSNLEPHLYSQALSMLEINGKIRPLGNDNWTLN